MTLANRRLETAGELSMQRVGHTVLALVFAAAAALIVGKLSVWRVIGPTFGLEFFLVTFVVFALVFYSFLEWLFRKMPDEIAKRVPTPSKELSQKETVLR
jgi:hypothetical protein